MASSDGLLLKARQEPDKEKRKAAVHDAQRYVGKKQYVIRFPGGASLEEIVLANALGRPVPAGSGPAVPCGVFMLPVPRPGVLRAVEGRAEALAVPGITGLTITIPPGQRVRPLPDGDRYLGFVFASGDTPADVEQALTTAAGLLRVIISDDRPGCRPSS